VTESSAWHEAATLMSQLGRRLIADGLAVGTAGNLSCRVGDDVVISPSSVPYEELEPGDMWVLGGDGSVRRTGARTVSSETPFHLAVYEATDARAVVHTHSPEVVAVSATCEMLPAIHYAIVRLGGAVPVIPYSRFGSDSLARGVSGALADRSAAILQNHGAVTYGRTLVDAYDKALLLEWLARTYRLACQLGTPRILTDGELEEVRAEAVRRRYAETVPRQP
jgi:L-fuculose-phosphate aldolase